MSKQRLSFDRRDCELDHRELSRAKIREELSTLPQRDVSCGTLVNHENYREILGFCEGAKTPRPPRFGVSSCGVEPSRKQKEWPLQPTGQ